MRMPLPSKLRGPLRPRVSTSSVVYRPLASIGENTARFSVVLQDVGGLRRDDDFHRINDGHHSRHAERDAIPVCVVALSAGGLVGETGFEPDLILRRQWGLLAAAGRLAWIPLASEGNLRVHRSLPLARPVRILRRVLRLHSASRR